MHATTQSPQSTPYITATCTGPLAPPLPAESTIVDIVELYDALSDEFRDGVPKDPDETRFIFAGRGHDLVAGRAFKRAIEADRVRALLALLDYVEAEFCRLEAGLPFTDCAFGPMPRLKRARAHLALVRKRVEDAENEPLALAADLGFEHLGEDLPERIAAEVSSCVSFALSGSDDVPRGSDVAVRSIVRRLGRLASELSFTAKPIDVWIGEAAARLREALR